jgi:hypothetical protein
MSQLSKKERESIITAVLDRMAKKQDIRICSKIDYALNAKSDRAELENFINSSLPQNVQKIQSNSNLR